MRANLASEVCPCHGEPWYVRSGGKKAGARECHIKMLERRRRNHEKVREYNHLYYVENREKWRSYYAENRENILERKRLRRKMLLSAGLCSQECGRPLATEHLCNECADKQISPKRLLESRRRQALRRKAARHQTEPGE